MSLEWVRWLERFERLERFELHDRVERLERLERPLVSALSKQFFNLRQKPRIFGLDGAFEHRYGLARPVEEVLVKVPARRLAGLGREHAIERVCVAADDGGLCKHRERDAVVHLAELRDLFVRSGLLAAEIVRRKPQDRKPFVAIAAV